MRKIAIYLLTQFSTTVGSLIQPRQIFRRTPFTTSCLQSTQQPQASSSYPNDTFYAKNNEIIQDYNNIHSHNVSRKGFISIYTSFTLLAAFTHILPAQAIVKNTATSLSISSSSGTAGYLPDMVGGYKKQPKGLGGLAGKVRLIGGILDELQRDLMQERWDLIERYPIQLRSYVPVFTTFTDSAFPTDAPTDKGLRVALRYEVGRFFASLERLRQATSRKSLDEAYLAYSEMSLHYDRYLHVGGLYTYYDATITNEEYFKGISRDALVFADPQKDPALVRDLVVLIKGPDMGKTGIVIGIYPDGSNNCVVKLDRFRGLREIRVVSRDWVGKRLGEQDPDDVFLIPRKES